MKIRQFKRSAISLIFGLAFYNAAAFAAQVQEIDAAKASGAPESGECDKHEVEGGNSRDISRL